MSPSLQPQAVVKSRPTGVPSHVVMALEMLCRVTMWGKKRLVGAAPPSRGPPAATSAQARGSPRRE